MVTEVAVQGVMQREVLAPGVAQHKCLMADGVGASANYPSDAGIDVKQDIIKTWSITITDVAVVTPQVYDGADWQDVSDHDETAFASLEDSQAEKTRVQIAWTSGTVTVRYLGRTRK